MTRTITDIRPVGIAPNLTLIADVKEDGCLLGYSVTIDQLTNEELTAYAVIEAAELEQEQHKALQIVCDVTSPKLPPAKNNTLQSFAEARERQFNKFYYGNKDGLPYFPHQTQEAQDK